MFNSTIVTDGEHEVIGPAPGLGAIARFVPMVSGKEGGGVMGRDYTGDRNTFWNPDTTQVFSVRTGRQDLRTNLEGWQKLTGQDQNPVWRKPEGQ